MLIVYVDLKMTPNLGKKCYEFFKLPGIFLILSFSHLENLLQVISISKFVDITHNTS